MSLKFETANFIKFAVSFFAANGFAFSKKIKEDNGVNAREIVEVRVDRTNRTIRWMVNNKQRA